MNFNPYDSNLPICDCFDDFRSKLNINNTLIVNAPPGAGKSTLLPLVLLNEAWIAGKKIIMLEPRRLAARTIATRMADLLGEKVGETIGYRIRFDSCISNRTIIEVVTEGILTRMLQTNNSLDNVACVLFDEFHERSIHADIALALCRESQNILRPDLRIVVMSATLNLPTLVDKLQAPVVTSLGRQFPVSVEYGNGVDERTIADIAARATIKAVKNHLGDCLVFLPGQAEIMQCAGILKNALPDFQIHPLYGLLSQSKQYHAIVPDKNGRRKIVIATSIAETSLTIQGIKIVIDSCLNRSAKFDPKSGLTRLETTLESKDSAEQRAGRAGRLSEGYCYRLLSPADYDRLPQHSIPEILEADLCSLVLEMTTWGVSNINDLCWLDYPPTSKVANAYEILESIDAICDGKITKHGQDIQHLPCHPRIAHALILSKDEGLTSLACDIAALPEERDPLAQTEGADINIRINALRRYRAENKGDKAFAKIEKIAAQYRKMLNIQPDNEFVDPFETGVILSYIFPERIACSHAGNNAQFQMANGKIAAIGHRDSLADESWIAVASVDARDGLGKIFLASPLNPKDLAHMIKKRRVVMWNVKTGLVASENLCIGSIILRRNNLNNLQPEEIAKAICEAAKKDGLSMLDFNSDVQQLQARIFSLRKWCSPDLLPDFSTENLLSNTKQWLAPFVEKIRRTDELKKLNLYEILKSSLSWEQQQTLDRLAPERLTVLSGSKIKLEYNEFGNAPILAVRIQEVFGLKETPKICDNKISVQLHLLSPAQRPVQITSDLNNFWNTTYHEIRKELRIKYPKHIWPEDPWNEPAVRGTKRKIQNDNLK